MRWMSDCVQRLLSHHRCAVFVDALMKVHGTRDIALEVGSVSERWKRTFKHVRMQLWLC